EGEGRVDADGARSGERHLACLDCKRPVGRPAKDEFADRLEVVEGAVVGVKVWVAVRAAAVVVALDAALAPAALGLGLAVVLRRGQCLLVVLLARLQTVADAPLVLDERRAHLDERDAGAAAARAAVLARR